MNMLLTPLTVAAALGSGVVAGLFFTFSTFVMQALGQIAPVSGIEAMQAINRTVMNPLTMGFFMGTAVLGLVSIAFAVWQFDHPAAVWLLAGGLLYLASFAITAAGNVPMNEALGAMDATADTTRAYWAHYLQRWTLFNHLRTVAACLATVAYVFGMRGLGA